MNEPTISLNTAHLDHLGMKGHELHRRINSLRAAVHADPAGQHEFERELVRQSLSAVQFWLGQIERVLPAVDTDSQR